MVNFLNEQQEIIIQGRLTDCKIIGNPGVGKTTIMIHKVCRHFEKGDLKSKKSFLIVTFTNNACREFIEKSKGQTDLFSDRNVMTIHKLASKIFKHFNPHRSFDVNTIINTAVFLLQTRSKEDIQSISCLRDLQLMIVDEAQDISGIQYELLCNIKRICNNVLMLIGDPNQNIFQFQGGSDRYLLDYHGDVYFLTINNRSTPSIVKFANYFRPNQLIPAMTASRSEKKKQPVEILRYPQEEIPDIVMRIIHTLDIDPSEAAIIGPVKRSKKYFNSYMNIGLSLFENLLMKHNIPFIQHYPTVTTESRDSNHRSRGKINLHTIHSAKGDEFHTVILLNFHFFTQGRRPTFEDYNQYMYLWWTGITRARDRLIIIMDNEKDHWPQLQTVPLSLYQLSGTPIRFKDFEVETPMDSKKTTIPYLLDDMSTEQMYQLHQLLPFDAEGIVYYDAPECSIIDQGVLVQQHLRLFFFYTAYKKRGEIPIFFQNLRNQFDCKLYIPQKYKKTYGRFLQIIGRHFRELISFHDAYLYKDQWEDDIGKEFFYQLVDQMEHKDKAYMIILENDVIFQDESMILKLIQDTESETSAEKIYKNLFFITLYNFQIVHEKKYMWFHRDILFTKLGNYNQYISIVQHIVDSIVKSDTHLEYSTHHPHLGIRGNVDVYTPSSQDLHTITFGDSSNKTYELILNYHNICPSMDNAELHIWDLRTGICQKIWLKPVNHFKLLEFMSKMSNCRLKNMKILCSLHIDSEGMIVDRYFQEITLGLCLSQGRIRYNDDSDHNETDRGTYQIKKDIDMILDLCEKPRFVSYDSDLRLLQISDALITRLKKIIMTFPQIKSRKLQKTHNHLFKTSRDYKKLSCKEEVQMMREIIIHLDLISKKLI